MRLILLGLVSRNTSLFQLQVLVWILMFRAAYLNIVHSQKDPCEDPIAEVFRTIRFD